MNEVLYLPNPLLEQQWQAAPESHAMMAVVGEEVANEAKAIVPVATGALRDSIVSRAAEGSEAAVDVVAEIEYAAFVEFGTSIWQGVAFLRPALDSVVGR